MDIYILRLYATVCCTGLTLLEPFLSDNFDPNSVTKLLELTSRFNPKHRKSLQRRYMLYNSEINEDSQIKT